MANKLTVQEQEAIRKLATLGWKIRRIARELGISRNTVRQYVRTLQPPARSEIAEAIVDAGASIGNGPVETDPHSTLRSVQIDPLSTPGKTGRKSLCEDHASVILTKVQAGLTAQRIYQDLKVELCFGGSYQSVKRYVGKADREESLAQVNKWCF